MTTATTATDRTAALAEIHLANNVRALDPEHVQALAGSIRLQGVLVPVVVRPADREIALAGWKFELVAGFHRVAAAAELGLNEIPIVVREADTEAAAATENIARKQLNPYEEARAVKAMLETRLSEDGAAQALGWPKQRVTARVKLLELPEQAQQLTGSGVIPLAAVDQLRTIGQVSPKLLDVLVDHVATEPEGWAGRQLATDPARALSEALRHSDAKVFAAYLDTIGSREIEELRLGKKTDELYAEAQKLHKQLDRYAYGPPTIRFSDQDVDEARAAGVLLELERSEPIIVDRPLYRELAKGAVRRTTEQLRVKAATAKTEKSATKANAGAPVDPVAEARREHGRELRELADQAHGANLDLGRSLMNGLATVEPTDMNVARLLVYGLIGGDHDGSPYSSSGNRVAELAMRGIRLVIEEFRTDVTKTRKDGSRGRLRIDYGDPRKPEDAVKWLWKFLDGARSAADLYGRAIVVLAAEQYACRLVLPSTQQVSPHPWPSHKDHARKALGKLAGPHLPATLKQLEKAIAKAHSAYQHAGPRRSSPTVRPTPKASTMVTTSSTSPSRSPSTGTSTSSIPVARSAPTGRSTPTPTRGRRAPEARG